VRALHPLLGDPERAYVLLYGSLWLWALANLSGEFALLARQPCVGGVGGGRGHRVVLVALDKVKDALQASKVRAWGDVTMPSHSWDALRRVSGSHGTTPLLMVMMQCRERLRA
jgi:hypothetical protein